MPLPTYRTPTGCQPLDAPEINPHRHQPRQPDHLAGAIMRSPHHRRPITRSEIAPTSPMRSDHHHKKPNKISPKHLTTTHPIGDNQPMNNTHTVHLDELTAQCAGFVNGGETWNGWAQPIFTAEQLAPIRTWWDTHDLTGETGERWEDQITQLSDDEYILPGWCWETTN